MSCPGAKLFKLRNGLDYSRIAFAFPRKYGNSVERNRSRRLSREAYRLLRNGIRKGYDLVLLVYPGRDTFQDRMEQLRGLFSRAGLTDLPKSKARNHHSGICAEDINMVHP